MTPAQRKYDLELAASLRTMSQQVSPRSRKLGDTLTLAADRIDALSSSIPVDQPLPVDGEGKALPPPAPKANQTSSAEPQTKPSPRQRRKAKAR